MIKGQIRVETRVEGRTQAVGTIPQFDPPFYGRVVRDADIGGIKARLNWQYGQVVSILVDENDVEKLKQIGFERD